MRRQYHFRKAGNDIHIWDVQRLIQLTRAFRVRKVPLADIQELNEAYWFPDKHPTTQQIIEHFQLVQDADLSYPVILCAEGRVMDGMHSAAKASLLNAQIFWRCSLSTPRRLISSISQRMSWTMQMADPSSGRMAAIAHE